ncbi:MAG: 4-deoxy-4-formamido-L-arabinose-phosphoundecaprenol deformylase [Lentisphaerota bacterium]
MKIGLKIDVDTFRGTRDGVLPICQALKEHDSRGTFFFSVGPDNMGRHLWRLLKPAFLAKMLRSKAASLYGWDILLRGTFLPGPLIGRRLGPVIKKAAEAGHEIGLHAWDHHGWQTHMEKRGIGFMRREIASGVTMLSKITGEAVSCSAAPAWKCNNNCLSVKKTFAFRFNSDCRGESVFMPKVDGHPVGQPQIPSTLPTYDEIIGQQGVTRENYNDHMIGLLKPGALNVLTIHAEVEGLSCHEMFRQFLDRVCAQGWQIAPLGDLIKGQSSWPIARMEQRTFPGREGWMAVQGQPPK